ncbi:MAG: ABC transporter ATP-binding protein [Ruminococcaceae bacterium]|nr:ABC transporter ATP-binding protein [Oscillospiraceae bacterium]
MKNKEKKKKSGLLRFLPYYKNYRGIMVKDMLCAALTTICELILPLIVREITTRTGGSAEVLTVKYVLLLGATYLILRIIDAAAYYYMANRGHVMGAAIETDMRRDLFAHLQLLPFKYYDNTKVGTLMSRITNDLFDVTEFAHHCPEEFFIAGIKIIASFVILCTMNVPLTIIVFAVIPPMIMVLFYFNSRMHAGFRAQRKELGELNAAVEDSLLGVRVVRSFAGEKLEEEKFSKGNSRFLKIKAKNYKYMGGFQSFNRFFEGFMYIVVVVAGALFMIDGKIDAPDFVAYLLYVTTLFATIRRIVEFAEQFQRGMTGIERFFEIIDTKPEIEDKENAVELKDIHGEIEFRNVTFRYSEENEDVLRNVSFTVKSGESVALVGPSGGGKTTICSLIPRFYECEEGSILVDGTDIKDVTLSSLRTKIGVVQQDVYLFSGSVYDNIEYGCPGATKEEIIEAAKLAGAHEFIEELPEGYDTYVGERGVKLSGGQKQRISIARVFLKNPPILLLDEATSALDNESEHIVQKSLQKLSQGRTTITVAHRLTTIKNADRIFVINKNGIAEEGTHEELLEKGGIYSELYKAYAQ